MKAHFLLPFVVVGLMVCQLSSFAQGTAFTYQGQLAVSGAPASGNYDFTFSLCDSSVGGDDLGLNVTNLDIPVTNGLFTAVLDFGQEFDGNARWLEINVRTNGASTFTTLAPRQQLTPTPYAITASNALTAATITGSLPNASLRGNYSGQVTLNNSSNVFSGSFNGEGSGLTNLNVGQFTAEVVTNNQSGVTLNGSFTGNGAGLTNLPFAETFASTNGYFTFAQNSDGSTNVTFIFTNGTPAEVGAQPLNSNLTALAGNDGGGLTNDLRALAVYVSSSYTVSASEVAAMQTMNIAYYVDTTAGNILFTFPTPPASANVTFSIVNFGTNTITLTNQPGSMFELANGYSGVYTNEVTVGGYFGKTMAWQNFNTTNWVQLASHRTVQEIRDIAGAYVGMVNGVGSNLTVNSNLMVNGLISGNGSGLTNLPFAETFSSTNGYFTFAQNPDGSTNVTFILTNLDAGNITGTLSETVLPTSAVLTNGASAVGQVPTWNGTNYTWSTINAGNVNSNTAVAFSSVTTTNLSATNIFPGYVMVGNTNLSSGGLIVNAGLTSSNAYLINNRVISGLATYPVASLIPVTPGSPLALDLIPSTGAIDANGVGDVDWIDLCNTNCLNSNPSNLKTLRLGESAEGNAIVGTIGLNGATAGGLNLIYNNGALLELNNNGIVNFANFIPAQSTVYNLGNGVQFFNNLYIRDIQFTNTSFINGVSSPGTVVVTTNLIVAGNLTVTNTASIKTNTAAFGTIPASITLGSTFTNLTGGRADFVGQFEFNGSGTGIPVLVISNLTSGLVITNSFPITSGTMAQGIEFPDVSPNDVCEAFDASAGTGASVSFSQGWWIVK
ncbi:MAG TPA: hypothetical protein VGI03_08970 [Verrucomicrobiae bacterium]|jgi:hypothetical protein